MSDQAPHLLSNNVSVARRGDQWIVEVVDSGQFHIREFILEAHASSYADGQRVRLGLYQRLPSVEDHHAK